MWKRCIVICLALLGTFSVVYAIERDISANTTTYSSGGSATGRIGNLQKGDKIILGIKDKDTNDLGWQLIKDLGSNQWLTMTTTAIGRTSQPIDADHLNPQSEQVYKNSSMKPYVTALNDQFASLSIETGMIIERTYYKFDTTVHQETDSDETRIFTPLIYEFTGNNKVKPELYLGVQGMIPDLSFTEEYYSSSIAEGRVWWLIGADGKTGNRLNFPDPNAREVAIRPAAKWKLDKIVFSVSNPTGTSATITSINTPSLPSGGVMKDYTGDPMKIRFLDSKLTIELDEIQKAGTKTERVQQNDVVDLAFSNGSVGANQQLSVILTDANTNEFRYYQQLGSSKANGTYELSTKDIAIGTYNVQLVNEIVTENNSPTYSSELSTALSLEVVEPHTITYTKSSQSGTSAGVDYEYNKNVHVGDKIGTITYDGKGIPPISYEITSFDGTDTSYKNFEIIGLTNGTSLATALDVKIKGGTNDIVLGTNSLKAGTYKFCIISKDADGSSTDKAKVCPSFTVEKAHPTIKFQNDDNAITYVEGKTTTSITHNEYATHTNLDASANDVNITYTSLKDLSSIIDAGLPFTSSTKKDQASITFKANMSGTITLQALIPASENYEQASTEKTIVVQLGLTGSYIEDQTNITAGSLYAKPPASYTSTNRIGHVNVTGGKPLYSYSLPAGKGDNGSFYINATTGDVYVNQSVSGGLLPGDYDIEIEVSDTTTVPKKQTITVTKKITVLSASLSGVAWSDPVNPGTALSTNTISTTYDPSKNGGNFNTKLIETSVGSLAGTKIEYKIDPDPNSVLSISQTPGINEVTATVKKASDSATKDKVKMIASISGGMYGTTPVTTEVYMNVDKYKQTIRFEDTSVLNLPTGSGCVEVKSKVDSAYSIPGGSIQYSTSDTSASAPFTIDGNNKICPTTHAGSADLIGTLSGDDNYSEAVTPVHKKIVVYEPGVIQVSGSIQAVSGITGVNYQPTTILKANDTNDHMNGTANMGTITATIEDTQSSNPQYIISKNTGSKNADEGYFRISPAGDVILKDDITANDIATHSTANIFYIQVDVTDDHGLTKTVDVEIKIQDADADFYFIDTSSENKLILDHVYDDGKTKIPLYSTAYRQNGTLKVSTNKGAIFTEDTLGDLDVIDSVSNGTFLIQNASDASATYGGMGGNTYVKACMKKQSGYSEQCIYAQIEITKAEQPDFSFVQSPTWKLGKTQASIMPIYNDKLSVGDVLLLSSSDTTIAELEQPIAGSDQSFKTTGKVGTTILTAIAPEDRNYKSAEAKTTLEITEKPQTKLSLFVPSMTYGDTGSKAQITSGYKSGVPAYFYVDDVTILHVDNNSVNTKESPVFTALGSGQVNVQVCQTSEPFDPTKDDCNIIGGDYGTTTIHVKQKPLILRYSDKEIYTGEAFPAYSFETPQANSFVGSDSMSDFPIPANTGAKEHKDAVVDTTQKGVYTIEGSYSSGELTGNAVHYDVSVQNGTLKILQDIPENSWFHLENSAGNILSSNDWHNDSVSVILDQATGNAGVYDEISNSITFTNADKTKFIVDIEDENITDIYFRIDPNKAAAHKGAITEAVQTTIKIDTTDPIIDSITGYPVNTSGLSNLLNEITLGHFFKPGVEIIIHAKDPSLHGIGKVSELEQIHYKVYELDEKGIQISTSPIDSGTGTPDTDGNMSVKVNKIGNYRVCATAQDHAANTSTEKCSDVNIKKIDVDEDGDGELDFNDSDQDGCPDLNILLGTDANGNSIKLNIAQPNKRYPYMNIDRDGDGIPDLNIDTDGDKKPDVNLVVMDESLWKPTICVPVEKLKDYSQPTEYCTGTDAEPQINVDVEGQTPGSPPDWIPDINIDTNGDFKPDLNITDTTGKPYLNIVKLHEWKPVTDYTYEKFLYDTIEKDGIIIERNQDSDGDGSPDINLDIDGDGTPDLNIDTDYDGIPDLNIDSDGDGKPDFNIDVSGNGYPEENIYTLTEWKPDLDNKKVNGFTFDTMEIKGNSELEDQGIKVEKPDGTFLPNYAIRVTDTTDSAKENVQKEAGSLIDEKQEIVSVYDVKLLVNDTETKPDGTIRVKVPIPDNCKNPQVLVKKSNGTYEKVEASIEDGYLIYETDELGEVSILSEKNEDKESPTKPTEEETPQPKDPTKQPDDTTKQPQTSVQGSYIKKANGIGGANTGDFNKSTVYGLMSIVSIGLLFFMILSKRRNHKE